MEKLLDCTNDDCKERIKSRDFQNHVDNECDSRLIECEYKNYGCDVNIRADKLKQHMNEYKFDHLANKFNFVTNKVRITRYILFRFIIDVYVSHHFYLYSFIKKIKH